MLGGFIPRLELQVDAAELDPRGDGIGLQLHGPLKRRQGVQVPELCPEGLAKGMESRHERPVDLEGGPQLDDGFVDLPLGQTRLRALQAPLLLDRRILDAGHRAQDEGQE